MGIEIKGIEELNRNLEVFKSEAGDILAKAAFNGCVLVANEAKQGHSEGAHMSGRYQDRTGNLTNSIQVQMPEVSDAKIKCEVIAGEEYAAVVELGGTHTPNISKTGKKAKPWRTNPYPYMFPALEKSKAAIEESVRSLLKSIRWMN